MICGWALAGAVTLDLNGFPNTAGGRVTDGDVLLPDGRPSIGATAPNSLSENLNWYPATLFSSNTSH